MGRIITVIALGVIRQVGRIITAIALGVILEDIFYLVYMSRCFLVHVVLHTCSITATGRDTDMFSSPVGTLDVTLLVSELTFSSMRDTDSKSLMSIMF